jgi:flagellar basal-body rod protein FlgB
MTLIDTTQLALESAMSGSMLRASLLNNNMANAETPGYKPEDVNFQSALDQAVNDGQSPDQVSFQPYTINQTVGPDGNGVSADQTSAQISENGLLFQDLSQIAATREQILKTAMGAA